VCVCFRREGKKNVINFSSKMRKLLFFSFFFPAFLLERFVVDVYTKKRESQKCFFLGSGVFYHWRGNRKKFLFQNFYFASFYTTIFSFFLLLSSQGIFFTFHTFKEMMSLTILSELERWKWKRRKNRGTRNCWWNVDDLKS